MEETLISFETAELLKDKGFNVLCKFSYDSDKGLQINEPLNKEDKCFFEIFKERKLRQCSDIYSYFPTYEEALEVGLQEALKLIK